SPAPFFFAMKPLRTSLQTQTAGPIILPGTVISLPPARCVLGISTVIAAANPYAPFSRARGRDVPSGPTRAHALDDRDRRATSRRHSHHHSDPLPPAGSRDRCRNAHAAARPAACATHPGSVRRASPHVRSTPAYWKPAP